MPKDSTKRYLGGGLEIDKKGRDAWQQCDNLLIFNYMDYAFETPMLSLICSVMPNPEQVF